MPNLVRTPPRSVRSTKSIRCIDLDFSPNLFAPPMPLGSQSAQPHVWAKLAWGATHPLPFSFFFIVFSFFPLLFFASLFFFRSLIFVHFSVSFFIRDNVQRSNRYVEIRDISISTWTCSSPFDFPLSAVSLDVVRFVLEGFPLVAAGEVIALEE